MSLSDMDSWMGALPDHLKLSEISMPGSHDAGVYREASTLTGVLPIPKSRTSCQDRSVLEQCEAGSRFFDVRLKVTGNSIRAHHTTARQGAVGESWDSTLESVAAFLDAHQSECVILRLTKPVGGVTDKIIEQLLQSSLRHRLYKSASLTNFADTTLEELRGKAICAFDPKEFSILHPSLGMHPFFRYEQGTPFGLVTCGKYSNSSTLKKVIDGQVAKIDAHADHGAHHLFVLYWTQTGGNIEQNTKATPQGTARQRARIAGGAHHNMDYLKDLVCFGTDVKPGQAVIAATDAGDRRNVMPNVIMYDFVNSKASKEIVSLNAPGLRPHLIQSANWPSR
jgi:hypothetical protein